MAYEFLALAYESKYVFDTIRSPMSYSNEYQDMPKKAGETDAEWDRRGPYYAILKRVERHKDFFERAFRLQPRCMAVFGTSAEDIFFLMHKSRREIEVSAQMLAWRQGFSAELHEQMERDIWDQSGVEAEKDKVGNRLKDFRLKTEAMCRPVVDRVPGNRRFLWRPRIRAFLGGK